MGVDAAFGHLADKGLPEDEARTLLDAALDPRSLDLLSVLGAR